MNPKGDGAFRRSLLAKNIFMSLTLLQILSNCAWGFACFFKSCPEGVSFLAGFLLCPGLKEKSLIREQKKRLPEGSLSEGFCNGLEGDIS